MAEAKVTNLVLEAQDVAGRKVLVRSQDADPARGSVRWWPVEEGLSRWVPNKFIPEQAIELGVQQSDRNDSAILAVSVHDLERAGLDIRRIRSIAMRREDFGGPYAISKLHRLDRQGAFTPLPGTSEPDLAVVRHSVG